MGARLHTRDPSRVKQIVSRRLHLPFGVVKGRVAALPVQQRQSWQAYAAQEAFHIRAWNTEERECRRLNQTIASQGLEIGPLFFCSSKYLRLGALGMCGAPGTRGDRDFDQMVEHSPTKTSLKPIENFAPSD